MSVALAETRIRAGVWEGVLSGMADRPQLVVLHLDRPVSTVEITVLEDRPGHWAVRVPIPAETLADGVQTYVIIDAATEARLTHFTVIAGSVLEIGRAHV